MKRIFPTIVCVCLAFMNVQGQLPCSVERAKVVCKKLRNTFKSSLYNEELQIERVSVANNRTLRMQLRCPSHSLEYRSEVKVVKWSRRNGIYVDFATTKPEDPSFFFPDETIQIGMDLSSFNQNGKYIFKFQLHTELKETFYVDVYLNMGKIEKSTGFTLITRYPEYEKLQKDEDHIYTWIDHHADFPGGNEGLVRFVKENIRYENLPTDLKWYQSVTIGMIIEKDGSLLYPETVDSRNRESDAEAMRLVSRMPKWKPGSIDGVIVRQRAYVEFYWGKLEECCVLFDEEY